MIVAYHRQLGRIADWRRAARRATFRTDDHTPACVRIAVRHASKSGKHTLNHRDRVIPRRIRNSVNQHYIVTELAQS